MKYLQYTRPKDAKMITLMTHLQAGYLKMVFIVMILLVLSVKHPIYLQKIYNFKSLIMGIL